MGPQGTARGRPHTSDHIRPRPARPPLTHQHRPCKNRARPALGGGKVNNAGTRAARPGGPGCVTAAGGENQEVSPAPGHRHKLAEAGDSARAPRAAGPRLRPGSPAVRLARCAVRLRAPARAMRPWGVRGFALELELERGGAYRGGELLCGRVLLEAAAPLRVRALEVAARGGATTHWLQGRSVGINAVSSDFRAVETYLRRRQLLLRGEPLTLPLRSQGPLSTPSPVSPRSHWDIHPPTPSKTLFAGSPHPPPSIWAPTFQSTDALDLEAVVCGGGLCLAEFLGGARRSFSLHPRTPVSPKPGIPDSNEGHCVTQPAPPPEV